MMNFPHSAIFTAVHSSRRSRIAGSAGSQIDAGSLIVTGIKRAIIILIPIMAILATTTVMMLAVLLSIQEPRKMVVNELLSNSIFEKVDIPRELPKKSESNAVQMGTNSIAVFENGISVRTYHIISQVGYYTYDCWNVNSGEFVTVKLCRDEEYRSAINSKKRQPK